MIPSFVDKAVSGEVTVDDVAQILAIEDEKQLGELFAEARAIKEKTFGNKIFTYGFVYFSTYCKNNCTFCYYRRSNDGLSRYRKDVEEVVQLAGSLKDAGINLADLTMGEDPRLYKDDYKLLLETISSVHDDVGISIMASPGYLPREVLPRIRDAGADWHACYQETYNRGLFEKLRLEQSFDDRRNQKIWAHEAGLLCEDGMMVGLGESIRDRAETIIEMGRLGCDQVRAMTFVPQEGTPMEISGTCGTVEELKAIAVMRILYPDRLIPASLDVEGISGLCTRINAGANVITSIVPPDRNLAGVAQHELDIENGNRSVEHVLGMLDGLGCRSASSTEYISYMGGRPVRRGA